MAAKKLVKQTTKAAKPNWRKALSQNRSKAWHDNMLLGRMEASHSPSLIRLARLKKRLDQATVAKRLDMSESTFGAIERAKRPVKPDVAESIARELDYPVAKLFKSARDSDLLKNPKGKRIKKLVAVIQKSAI